VAAPTFVQFTTGSAQSTTVSVSAPTGTLSGDHQLIWLGVPSTSITVTSVPSGWTLERTQQNTNDATPFTLRCYKSSTATVSAAFTVSSSTTLTAVRVTYRGGTGVESSVGSADSGSSTNHALATATTTVADSLVVAAGYEDSSGTSKTHTMSGWTERVDFATSGLTRVGMIAAYDIVKATAGTQGGTIVSSGADLMATISVVLAATAGTTYDRTGGAAGRGAGSGTQSVIPANFINRTGGGAARSAGSGTRIVTTPHLRAGGAAARGAGSGTRVVTVVPPLPSDVLDLSYWHLTTPEDEGDGTAEQIDQPALDSYESDNFYVDENGFVVCIAPVDGFSTSAASGATRMELRQHRKGTYANAAMDPNGSGRWQMTITTSADPTSITGGSNPRQELIIAQIHGAGDSPIPLILSAEWTSGGNPVTPRVRIFKNGPGLANIITGITTSTRLSFRIRIGSGRLKVWGAVGERTALPPITDSTPYDWPIPDFTDQEGWYFKAGAYHKTTITSGSSGVGIAKISYLNVLEPSDAEESTSTTYERTGGGAARGAGSGAKVLSPAAVHAETGGGATRGAGSGARTLASPAVHAKTGEAAARSAGSGARVVTSATTYNASGGAAARGASSGVRALSPAAVHTLAGGAAALGVGVGEVEHELPESHERTGAAALVAAGSGAQQVSHTYVTTGGAAALGAGSGAKDITSIAKTGGGAAVGAGDGVLQTGGGVTHGRTGGAGASAAGAGARTVGSATVYVRTAGASTSAAGSGAGVVQSAVVHTRTGGASASAAGTGLAQHVPAVRHDRTGGGPVAAAGTGTRELVAPTVHAKSGGSAALAAGGGTRSIAGAAVHVRTGGAAARGSGIGLVEVIPATVHVRAGGAVLAVAGSGRGRVGGRMHAAAPVAVGQFRSGSPVRR
jgi:hypothetical protein